MPSTTGPVRYMQHDAGIKPLGKRKRLSNSVAVRSRSHSDGKKKNCLLFAPPYMLYVIAIKISETL